MLVYKRGVGWLPPEVHTFKDRDGNTWSIENVEPKIGDTTWHYIYRETEDAELDWDYVISLYKDWNFETFYSPMPENSWRFYFETSAEENAQRWWFKFTLVERADI